MFETKPSVHPLCEPNELSFAQLLAYIEEQLETEEPLLLTLSDLVKFYMCKLRELFGEDCGTVNSTHLKERILDDFPDLTAHTKDRNKVHLVLKHEIGGILSNSGKNIDSDARCLARAAHIVRREVLDVKNSFNGQFQEGCQKHSVAPLLTLLGMIMKGPTTKCDHSENQACLSIAQLVVYNSVTRARQRSEATGATHHIKSRECPLPIYTALKLHGATRDKALIDSFYNLGICISYDRLMSISTQISNSVFERYEHDRVVCPPKLRKGLFTTAAVDNIDHNPSSTTSQGSFHGTAISLV